ncbi:MAG: cellulase family glycosylhydrolase [Polyangiales bacterium]
MRSSSFALLVLAATTSLGACHGSSSDPPAAPAAATCSIALPAPKDWRLRADGRHLRDGLGRLVLLRGVNAGTRSKWAPYMPFDFTADTFDAALAAFMDRAAAWGLNVLRLPFTWAAVEPTKGMDDETFLKRYDAMVDAAWKRGIRILVDFHQDVYAENFCGDGFPAWTLPDPSALPAPHHDCTDWGTAYLMNADVKGAFDRFWADGSSVQKDYVALWTRMATRYKDRPGVIGFEPINEPSAGTTETGAFEKTTLRDFYTRMIASLHAIAPDTLVFVDTIGFDGGFASTTLEKPTGDGFVFAPHYYPLARPADDVVHNGLEKWAAVATAWNVPVFVGEFGLAHGDRESPDTYAYITWHYDAFDDQLMSGTQWEYSVSAEDWNAEGMSLAHPDGTEWKLAGALVRPYARATAGKDVVTAYDSTVRSFTLAYTPDSEGVSEITLPTRLAPQGIDMQLAGGCYDASHPGVVLVKSDTGAAKVQLTMTVR